MKVVKPSFEILTTIDKNDLYKQIELAARTCYKSEDKITDTSAIALVESLVKRGHMAMLEHASVTVRFICDRGVSHEIVRHRVASYAQESTRYCNYGLGKHGKEITVVRPSFFEEDTPEYAMWYLACSNCEEMYMNLLSVGRSPQEARCVLPHSLKTEIISTMNLREWAHFFDLRAIGTSGDPHPQIKEIARPLLKAFAEAMPEVFGTQYEQIEFEYIQ